MCSLLCGDDTSIRVFLKTECIREASRVDAGNHLRGSYSSPGLGAEGAGQDSLLWNKHIGYGSRKCRLPDLRLGEQLLTGV